MVTNWLRIVVALKPSKRHLDVIAKLQLMFMQIHSFVGFYKVETGAFLY